MRLTIQLLLAMTFAAALAQGARAEGAAAPIHVATYLEVAASSAKSGATLLGEYRDASRKENGNLRAEVARELGRTNRFVMLEIWTDQAAFEAHARSPATAALRDKLKPIQNGPYDERVHNALNVGPNEAAGKRGVYVVSHVDVPPPRKDECIALLNPLADASRKGAGSNRFEVVQQTNRPNHFTVVEIWKDKKAYDASRAADAQRAFRDKLGPMLGALYDERLYRAID